MLYKDSNYRGTEYGPFGPGEHESYEDEVW